MAQTLVNLLVHVVFSTKERRQLIRAETKQALHSYMAGTLNRLDSPCLEIGGTANHIHALIALNKNSALTSVVAELKKSSSKWIKSQGAAYALFGWQDGYGAFSVGQSQVPLVKRYIAGQEAHHRTRTFEAELVAMLKKYAVAYDERFLWK